MHLPARAARIRWYNKHKQGYASKNIPARGRSTSTTCGDYRPAKKECSLDGTSDKEYERQLYVSFQLALREYISGLNFDEVLEKKDTITPYILDRVGEEAKSLGILISSFGIRD